MRLEINLPITQNPLNTLVGPAAEYLGLQRDAVSQLIHHHELVIAGRSGGQRYPEG
jgi:hypothetical protein